MCEKSTSEVIIELINEFGRPITPKDLAMLLNVDPRTVIKYADRWGGIEICPGTYRFFENLVKEAFNGSYSFKTRKKTVCGDRDGHGVCDGKNGFPTQA